MTIMMLKFLSRRYTNLWKNFVRYESDFEMQYKTPCIVKAVPLPMALYGGRYTVTMIPGSGLGPEMLNHVKQVFKYGGVPVDFENVEVDSISEDNKDLKYAITSVKRNGVAIKGNFESNHLHPSYTSRNVAFRNKLDLYVYVLHCKTYQGIPAKHKNVDIVLIRQNTEGEYSMIEHSGVRGIVESLKVITRSNSLRLAKYTLEYVKKHNRKKITIVHKANIMKLSDGLFLKTIKDFVQKDPEIEVNEMIVDNCCMQLVSNPQQFDVIVTTNLYGNVLANVICGISGGPGLFSGRNYGEQYALFETGTRNTGTLIAGKNVANPVTMLKASVDMLKHLGLTKYAAKIDNAIMKTICEKKIRTFDIGGTAKTSDVVSNIIEALE